MTTIQITTFFDAICPWCLIGKRQMQKAIANNPQYSYQQAYLPYQLNPDMPIQGMPRQAYLNAKFGGADAANAKYQPVRDLFDELQIPAQWDAIKVTPNTSKAHILVQHLQSMVMQDETIPKDSCDKLLESLFSAYFYDGMDIGDDDTLEAIWQDCLGDKAQEITPPAELWQNSQYHKLINESQRQAVELGVQGVPFGWISGGDGDAKQAVALSGAQPPEALAVLFQKAIQAS